MLFILLVIIAYMVTKKLFFQKNKNFFNYGTQETMFFRKHKSTHTNQNQSKEPNESALDKCISYLKSITSKILDLFMVPLRLKILDRIIGILTVSLKIIGLSIYAILKSIFNIIYKLLKLIWVGIICPVGRLLDKSSKKIQKELDDLSTWMEDKTKNI